jgi:hypothetical protein
MRPWWSQSNHDRNVEMLAYDYYNRGYEVWADQLSGWSKPSSIGGYKPDIIARRNGHVTVVEVETQDSVNSTRDLAQQAAFSSWASRSPYRHFRRVVV